MSEQRAVEVRAYIRSSINALPDRADRLSAAIVLDAFKNGFDDGEPVRKPRHWAGPDILSDRSCRRLEFGTQERPLVMIVMQIGDNNWTVLAAGDTRQQVWRQARDRAGVIPSPSQGRLADRLEAAAQRIKEQPAVKTRQLPPHLREGPKR